jgi:hypothetical protein
MLHSKTPWRIASRKFSITIIFPFNGKKPLAATPTGPEDAAGSF